MFSKYFILRYFILAIIVFLSSSKLSGQTHDPLSYFPHHLNNYWEYIHFDPNGLPFGYSSRKVDLDSLLANGNYLVRLGGISYNINTTTYQVLQLGGTVLYELDASLGEWWYYYYHDSTHFSRARVIDEYDMLLFSVPTSVKVIDYWSIFPEDSLWDFRHYLATNFGLIGKDVEGADPESWITCSIIENIQYGNCMFLDIDVNPSSAPNDDFKLDQNYPNPFNQSTHISFKIPRAVYVDLSIYNILGEKVITLVNRVKFPGRHSVEWDGLDESSSEVPSGIYMLKLNAGVFTEYKKMIIIK